MRYFEESPPKMMDDFDDLDDDPNEWFPEDASNDRD
jgi:hypothetical protein